ncbi:MAG: hypothetical protein GY719_42350 [bacterium]|nr:hypothetical protein [bacterium]
MPPKIKVSRGLRDRIKLAEILGEVLGSRSKEITSLRAEALAPDLRAGETMPDGDLENELGLRALKRRLDDARAAERDYSLAAVALKSLQIRIGEATAELSGRLRYLRQIVDLALGKGASRTYLAFRGRTPRRQDGVYSQAADVLARLGGLRPSEPVLRGVSANPAQWRRMIEPAFRQLDDLRRRIKLQEKRLDGLLIAKKKAFDAFDGTARGLVRIAEGQCLLAGRKDLAKQIRRLSRKRKRPGPKPKRKAKKKKKKKQASGTKIEPEKPEKPKKEKARNPATSRVA